MEINQPSTCEEAIKEEKRSHKVRIYFVDEIVIFSLKSLGAHPMKWLGVLTVLLRKGGYLTT